eukprot:PITA_35918
MANNPGMQKPLLIPEAEDQKSDSQIEPDLENPEKGVNIDNGNLSSSVWTDIPLESKYIENYSEDTEKGETAIIANCADDENELHSGWVDLKIVAGGENLLTISLAVVYLVDGEWSVEVGTGEFSIVRHIVQGRRDLALVAKVGDNLRWPISKDMRAFKLGKLRYLFLIVSPPEEETFKEVGDIVIVSDVAPAEELNYVVSFDGKHESSSLALLEKLLQKHAQFTDSSVMDKESSRRRSYNCRLAKAIAAGTGQLVKGLYFCSGAYSSQVQKGGKLLKNCMEANVTKGSEINPRFVKSIERVKRLSKATENISDSALKSIHDLTAGVVRISASNSKAGQKFFKTLPGEMFLVSWDSFNQIMEAVEEAGKDALISTSTVATDIVKHRFGDEVGEVARDTFAFAGHTMATARNIAKLRNVINPASYGVKSLRKAIKKSLK